MISTIERIGELRETLQEARRAGARIALVPTMGALHDGHLALVDRAREIADVVVVSIFVNPLQFGPNEDLDRYPRDLAADVALLEERGVAYVFAPTVAEMYPDGPSSTRVVAGNVGSLYEGRSRPGHFDGMLTVVSKLLHIVQPDVAMFGQKDAQQLFLVRRMVRDLDLPVAIEGVDTVREEDGLALSSRNRYLDARERRAARTIPLLLEAAASAADRGIDAVIAAAQSASMGEPLVKLDYLVVANPATLLPVDDDHRGPALVLVAAVVGSTRLLDNGPILLA
ncbi:pantoate--beta-alanine ligase [Rathayibacter sp. VKM Ac-2927]|uniref:pantoate--beta-alanine ligase n=1 Tax=Rathayibacter sp. VKM Ac-2927 TaxID=2929478 RepID=UPI001FB42C77|nr:pantoate--beta-alanine ligase [Rathayibacter sp. VKM Ac-2927]MCJ1686853.1 pantoate--beta-alanine ligase [Rathayibacter sp. VKM Ac-2927]